MVVSTYHMERNGRVEASAGKEAMTGDQIITVNRFRAWGLQGEEEEKIHFTKL